MKVRVFCSLLLCSVLLAASSGFAGIVEDVRNALAQNYSTSAESQLKTYRDQHGVTPEYLEALSWMARGSLANHDLPQALTYAAQAEALTAQQLKGKSVDSDPHFATAMGAALEVQAQAFAAQGKRAQAISLLQRGLSDYGRTSIRERLKKNLNLLALPGAAAPSLKADQYLGSSRIAISQLKGSPALLFFWAHWCVDCKMESPILTRLRSEYSPKGLAVVAPTRYYGYTAQKEHVGQAEELAWIQRVWQQFYPGLQDVSVPISQANFDTYGASTTPTIVLLDRTGKVSLYHPGAMSYDDLRAAIDKVVSN